MQEYTISWAHQPQPGSKPVPMYVTYMGPKAHDAASCLIHALVFNPKVVFIGIPKSLEHVLVELVASDMILKLLAKEMFRLN